MRTIRFARLNFEPKLSHYSDPRSAIERRKASLLEVIDFSTDVNSLLRGTDMDAKIDKGEWSFGDVEEGGGLLDEDESTGRGRLRKIELIYLAANTYPPSPHARSKSGPVSGRARHVFVKLESRNRRKRGAIRDSAHGT